jgi:hypothetical protein
LISQPICSYFVSLARPTTALTMMMVLLVVLLGLKSVTVEPEVDGERRP